MSFGVSCGQCGGEVYMLPCPEHEWVIASECYGCGLFLSPGPCEDCYRQALEEKEK
jgi:hypothetical protein